MIRKISFITILLLFSYFYMFSNDESYTLPDGKKADLWKDNTYYTQIYHVNVNHPDASDDNSGTFDKPFRTINRAASIVKPGEKVKVYSGVYREQVRPLKGGESSKKMVAYEVPEGNKVLVKGSVIFNESWEESQAPYGEVWAHNLWQAPLDDSLFSPFYTDNANKEEIDVMPWAEKWSGRIPYTLGRGLVFQNGRRLLQLSSYEDISWVEGSFWVDEFRKLIHIHPFKNIDPNEHVFELTMYQQLFNPQKKGLSFIKVKGFIFEHAGNGFPRVGVGALFVKGGENWIIEDNVVRECNSVAIEIGARITEKRVSSEKENQRIRAHKGGMVVRDNHIYNCGTGGIQGHTVRNTVMINNHIHNIGWQHVERYWECAAIKTLKNINVIATQNVIHDVEEACAIWFDWDNKNARITGNVIYNIDRNYNGAIFIEASRGLNQVDNNFIWGVKGIGISLNDTEDAMVCHNLIAESQIGVSMKVITDRKLNNKPLKSENNIVKNNLFYNNSKELLIEDDNNVSDYNAYAENENQINELKERGFDRNSSFIDVYIQWNPLFKEITFYLKEAMHEVPFIESSKTDFWNHTRDKSYILPGIWNVKTVGEASFLLVE